jgi:hypothetical protein
MPTSLPDELQRLIYEHLPTMDHVELLVFLVRAAPEPRDLPEIVSRVAAHNETIGSKLEELVKSGLVAAEREGDVRRYRYAPAGLKQRFAVEALLEAYEKRQVTLIRLIYERPTDAAQQFADAFLFKKPKE